MLTKKALAAAGHEQIPFLVSRPRRHLPSTPLDLLQAKAVDQNLQRSSTDRIRTTATALYRLVMRETYEHPIILWRRADHRPLHETGLFLQSRMLQKVSVLCLVSSHIPSRFLSLSKRVRLHQFCVIMNSYLSPTIHIYSSASGYASMPLINLSLSPLCRGDGPGCYYLQADFHFHMILIAICISLHLLTHHRNRTSKRDIRIHTPY